MKKNLLIFSLVFFSNPLFADPYTVKKNLPLRTVESFSQYDTGKFPISFRTYPFQRGKAMKVYSVQSEGENKYLSAFDDKDISVQVFKRYDWDIRKWPHFSWQWRAKTLPKGAAERNPQINDSACGVYVVFGGYTGDILKYVWSTTLPVGTVYEKKPGKFFMIVLQSSAKNANQWKTEAVNVVEDYKRVFKKDPPDNPQGFGLLTDGNATHTPAACDYDEFRISESPL